MPFIPPGILMSVNKAVIRNSSGIDSQTRNWLIGTRRLDNDEPAASNASATLSKAAHGLLRAKLIRAIRSNQRHLDARQATSTTPAIDAAHKISIANVLASRDVENRKYKN
jgi:hypothetical protein